MKKALRSALLLATTALLAQGCDSKESTVGKGREAVKEVLTQPLNTVDSAKDSLRQSEEKQKAGFEAADKENK